MADTNNNTDAVPTPVPTPNQAPSPSARTPSVPDAVRYVDEDGRIGVGLVTAVHDDDVERLGRRISIAAFASSGASLGPRDARHDPEGKRPGSWH